MKSWLPGEPLAITRAPRAWASWIAKCPTPPAPPVTNSVSPPRSPSRSSDWCAVSEASGSAAASSKESPSGMCARKPSGTVVNSA